MGTAGWLPLYELRFSQQPPVWFKPITYLQHWSGRLCCQCKSGTFPFFSSCEKVSFSLPSKTHSCTLYRGVLPMHAGSHAHVCV